MIIDSHCHIYDEKLKQYKKEILKNLVKTDQVVVCCADNLKNSKKCLSLANKNTNVFAGVGIHPECITSFNKNTIKKLENFAISSNKVVAIGEIGLDYHYDKELQNKFLENNLINNKQINNEEIELLLKKVIDINHNKQKEFLIKQISLAKQLNLPCIFHIRDSVGDFLEILKELKNNAKTKDFKIKGVVHSFSGSFEVAQIYLNYGLYLGINGVVTFKNAKNLVEVVGKLPLEKMLIETDSPYLTPEPNRGSVNKPEYVKFVAQKLAEIKNISVEDVIKITTENAIRLFNLNI